MDTNKLPQLAQLEFIQRKINLAMLSMLNLDQMYQSNIIDINAYQELSKKCVDDIKMYRQQLELIKQGNKKC